MAAVLADPVSDFPSGASSIGCATTKVECADRYRRILRWECFDRTKALKAVEGYSDDLIAIEPDLCTACTLGKIHPPR